MRDTELNHVYFQSILSAIEDLCWIMFIFRASCLL